MGKTFGAYIAEQRQKAGLGQSEVFGENSQGYVSSIENNKRIPSTRKGIENLATALKMKTSPKFIDWLWAYALFGSDPIEYFQDISPFISSLKPSTVAYDSRAVYGLPRMIDIPLGSTQSEVERLLGQPDRILSSGHKKKLSYHRDEVHVLLEHDRVVDVVFK